jgi:hypothetical protein
MKGAFAMQFDGGAVQRPQEQAVAAHYAPFGNPIFRLPWFNYFSCRYSSLQNLLLC